MEEITSLSTFITDDVRIEGIRPLISPAILMEDIPADAAASQVVYHAREAVSYTHLRAHEPRGKVR